MSVDVYKRLNAKLLCTLREGDEFLVAPTGVIMIANPKQSLRLVDGETGKDIKLPPGDWVAFADKVRHSYGRMMRIMNSDGSVTRITSEHEGE